MQIGNKIKDFRIESNISQRELGRRIGKTGQFISLIEQGKSSPSIDTLYSIAEALNIPSKEFLSDNIDIHGEEFKAITGSYVLEETLKEKEFIIPFIEHINKRRLNSKYNVKQLLNHDVKELVYDDSFIDLMSLLTTIIDNRLNHYQSFEKYKKRD
ncbi:helix-turn-helix transcriptional regulator [Clostridium sp. YIM B02506]|uniref:helix-turn-helix domain-containing protein n=1 Tax=Clostridium sp. YIM B02506 TaxID=2910680 RepID=UPI001EEEC5E5|nr:helix-turn-helix transcriptional regulator [Clostridium sp. YIM B02506]